MTEPKKQRRRLTEQERWKEYARLKQERFSRNGWETGAEYEQFIDRITRELGI